MQLLDLITQSLRSIGVVDVTESPSAEAGANALINLNNLMATLAEDGIDLGYTATSTITDDFALSAGHVGTIEALLAMKEASDRGIAPSATLSGMADSGYRRLLLQAQKLAMQPASLSGVSHGLGSLPPYNILTG